MTNIVSTSRLSRFLLAAAIAAAVIFPRQAIADTPIFLNWAATPPMGWNSYDCFGTAVTEDQVLANAAYLKKNLLSHGWSYVVIDARWADPSAAQDSGSEVKMLVDDYGRLVPDPKRFPSVGGGKSFKPLADKIHAMGLKFGIHVQRGIPRSSVRANTRIEGSDFHAIDAANPLSTCSWCGDMYGVDGSSPAGRAWYESLIRLYASWGVDFIKVDDIASPYSASEIAAVRLAIDNVGRPIVLSLSPGPTGTSNAAHVKAHANMWRIRNDSWDNWSDLKELFGLLDSWSFATGTGNWPDADMLPLGMINYAQGQPRMSNYKPDEQVTLMTLFCIARSPLIVGGNLPENDPGTLSLLNNDEVLAVNQNSSGNHQLFEKDGIVAWVADVPGSSDKYVALFNLNDEVKTDASVTFTDLRLSGPCQVRDLWNHKNLGLASDHFVTTLPAHGAVLVRVATGAKQSKG